MDLVARLQQEVSNALMLSVFDYVPGKGRVREINFAQHGEVVDPLEEITRWQVDVVGAEAQLRLWRGGDLLVNAKITPQGIWRGRDRGSRGFTLVRPPEAHRERWKKFTTVKGWLADVSVDESDPGFRMDEMLAPQINWAPFKFDIRAHLTEWPESVPVSETGVAIIAYDRPHYFQRVVHALAQNPEIERLPVFGFFDLPPPERAHTVDQQVAMLREAIPQAVIVKRPRNFGCGRNIIDARRQLFDHLKYDRVWVFEDDCIVSPTYMGLVTRLFDWAQERYSNIGAVQGWVKCLQSRDWKQANLNRVQVTWTNWWAYLQSRESWQSVRDDIYRYEDIFLGSEYARRPHRSIVKWFHRYLSKGIAQRGDKPVPLDKRFMQHRDGYMRGPPSGQDAITMVTFYRHGWFRLMTAVNRAEYIGQQGIHMNPRIFKSHRFPEMTYEEFPEDAVISDFELGAVDVPEEEAVPGIAQL